MARPSAPLADVRPRVSTLARWSPLAVIAAVISFMFWTRWRSVVSYSRTNRIYLAGIDSYYQFRTTMYTVERWPNTMPYDVWTEFPDGTYVGQFGTAYDQLIATAALVVGLGDPSEALVHETVLVVVPLVGALIAIPIYFIGKRLGGRVGGVVGIVLLALLPGQIYTRTLTGQFQHHGAEMLFMSIAVLAVMYALGVAERDRPIFQRGSAPRLAELRPTALSAGIAGATIAFYQWVWPPGVVLVGILGVFLVGYVIVRAASGGAPEHVALVGAISMGVAGVLVLGTIERMTASPSSFGYLSPVLSFGIMGGCVFMGWLSRYRDRTALSRWTYVGTILASVGIFLGVLWLLLPDVGGQLLDNLQGRILPFGHQEGTLTIQEAQPPDAYLRQVVQEFGLSFFTALLGLAGIGVALVFRSDRRAEHAFVVVWALVTISMSMAQIRFFYYLALVVAVLNASLVGQLLERVDVDRAIADVRSIEAAHVLVIGVLLLVLVVPLLPGLAPGSTVLTGYSSAHESTFRWQGSLEYLSTSTPEIGRYGGHQNELEYYGTYDVPADGSYDYPPGAYGVISWWTYGHLIAVDGERIPHSNPFQAGATSSAAYLLAQSEERANLILDAIPTGASVDNLSTDALEPIVAERDPQDRREDIRYVMIDAPMATGDFASITPWAGPDFADYLVEERVMLDEHTGEHATLPMMGESYHNTTLASLYLHDATRMEHYRLVHESSRMTTIGSIARHTGGGEWEPLAVQVDFSNLNVPTGRTGFRSGVATYDVFPNVSEVKTFERVEGATIRGETDAEPGSHVNVELDLTAETSGRDFTYSQQTTVAENGTFELTVPYATTEELGPADGYTETTVRADDAYSVRVLDGPYVEEWGTVDVPEPAIYEGEHVQVELEAARTSQRR